MNQIFIIWSIYNKPPYLIVLECGGLFGLITNIPGLYVGYPFVVAADINRVV